MAGSDGQKLTVVIAKYAHPCKTLVEHPDQRMQYWLGVERAGIAAAKK
jgi:hypothetical protein